jgi:hypothetical protein
MTGHMFIFVTLLALISGQAVRVERVPTLRVDVATGGKTVLRLSAEGMADVQVPPAPAAAVRPLAWRAFAHGARAIALNGQASPDSSRWVEQGAGIAREFQIHGTLLAQCRSRPPVRFEGRAPAAFEVTLLEADRTFVLVATNTSGARVRGAAVLPPAVPYAMWLNLLDGSSMAMLEQPAGPKWAFEMAPWSVKVYVIDKTLK